MKIMQTGESLLEEMRAVARGERLPPGRPQASLSAVLSPESVELLKLLARTQPENVKELARQLDRAPSNVSRTLALLVDHGFVRMVRNGKHSRPELVAQCMTIQFDAATGAFRAAPKAA